MGVTAAGAHSWFPLPDGWRAHAAQNAGTVLLETAAGLGSDHTSYLFHSPEDTLQAGSLDELDCLFAEIAAAGKRGLYAAGSMDYEAAYAIHQMGGAATKGPFAHFGLYREPLCFDHRTGECVGRRMPGADSVSSLRPGPCISRPQMRLDHAQYQAKFDAVKALLASGDTYQVNLTTHVDAGLLASPLELYEALIEQQPVDFAAIVHLGEGVALSLSPELFFHIENNTGTRRILTRPMKGTAARGATPEGDVVQMKWLAADEKNRAEHVMIVDLLRNDLGRVCLPGSVRAAPIFRVESFPTLFQMTSDVAGTLRASVSLTDVFFALFPSGSVTGAPKRRTMEIIRELEDAPRGLYTGAVGFVTPDGDACFNIPIRTVELDKTHIRMGVGGGIVADSIARDEYEECVLKSSFLSSAAVAPHLIETLLYDGDQRSGGFPHLELHLARLARSAAELGFRCKLDEVRDALLATAYTLQGRQRVRLLLSRDGATTLEATTLSTHTDNLRVRVSGRRVRSSDPWLRHKTTRRGFYDRELARARAEGFDEVLFLNERGDLTEGAISSLFVVIAGNLCTPPLAAGLLPGVFRQHLLDTHPGAREMPLRLADVQSARVAYLCNAVRGLRPIARLEIE